MALLCHGPLVFTTIEPLLPLPLENSLENPLDHESGYYRPTNRPLGDLKFHGHSYIFFLDVNQSGPGMSSMTNYIVERSKGQLHRP